MISAANQGTLKALFMLAENPGSDGTGAFMRRALEKCDFVVLCEVLNSELSHYADVCLPGLSFAETTGTYTNTERRIQMVRQAIQPQWDSKPEWQIISELARRILSQGGRQVFGAEHAGWSYTSTSEIMNEIAALTPIYAGVSHERLEKGDYLMWPVYSFADAGSPVLYGATFPIGKGRFVPVE
jgi:predicted molibdopterin-dependent oxidoreductase YjgC